MRFMFGNGSKPKPLVKNKSTPKQMIAKVESIIEEPMKLKILTEIKSGFYLDEKTGKFTTTPPIA